jgi:hypothetical protein
VSNQEQVQLPELRIVCGVSARRVGHGKATESSGEFESDVVAFFASLHEHNGFDLPSAEIIGGLHSIKSIAALVDSLDAGVIESDNLKSFVQSFSDLDSLSQILRQLDSPEFAIWCGVRNSNARDKLMCLRSRIEGALIRMRSHGCGIDVVVPADPMTIKELRLAISQAALMGLHVDSVQLLWTSKIKSKKIRTWAKKLRRSGAGVVIIRSNGSPVDVTQIKRRSSRSLRSGALVEIDPSEYLYVMEFKNAAALAISVGICDNCAVVQLDEVRRFVPLPAACSRMQAHNAILSSQNISIYFTVKEELWPTPQNQLT